MVNVLGGTFRGEWQCGAQRLLEIYGKKIDLSATSLPYSLPQMSGVSTGHVASIAPYSPLAAEIGANGPSTPPSRDLTRREPPSPRV